MRFSAIRYSTVSIPYYSVRYRVLRRKILASYKITSFGVQFFALGDTFSSLHQSRFSFNRRGISSRDKVSLWRSSIRM